MQGKQLAVRGQFQLHWYCKPHGHYLKCQTNIAIYFDEI